MTLATTTPTTVGPARSPSHDRTPRRPPERPGIRRRCVLLTALALLLLTAYVASVDRTFGVDLGGVEISFTNSAVLAMEGSDGRWHAPGLFGFPFVHSYYKPYWRPYHVTEIGRQGVFIPLWQPLLI